MNYDFVANHSMFYFLFVIRENRLSGENLKRRHRLGVHCCVTRFINCMLVFPHSCNVIELFHLYTIVYEYERQRVRVSTQRRLKSCSKINYVATGARSGHRLVDNRYNRVRSDPTRGNTKKGYSCS